MSLLLYCTFNEQGSHDLSENGNNGTDTSITYSAADVGYNAVFNATTDSINFGNITSLNNQAVISFYMRIKFVSAAAAYHVFLKSDVVESFYDGTDFTVVCNGVTVTLAAVDTGVYYNIHYIYDVGSGRVELYSNNTLVDLETPSGNTPNLSTNVYLGNAYLGTDGSTLGANFEINELKVYNNALTAQQRQSHIDNINGIELSVFKPSIFTVGDILVSNELISPIFSICTYSSENSIRIQPITSGLTSDMKLTRIGHLWNTDRQYYNRITDTGIKYYQGVSLSTEYNTDAKLTKQDTVLSNEIVDNGTVDTDKDNFDLSQEQDIIILQPDANRVITGIVAPTYARRITIINDSSFDLQYDNESGSSTAANRIIVGIVGRGAASHTQKGNTTIELLYDTVNSRWRIINE